MPYRFNFNLSKLPQNFFQETLKQAAKIVDKTNGSKKIEGVVAYLMKNFRVDELTGLNTVDALKLLRHLVDINVKNLLDRDRFFETKTNERVIFLPHCSRKYMDKRCNANFDKKIPSYVCNACSDDCLINQATKLARKYGYDVYILSGGSCIPYILEKGPKYKAVLGVACTFELDFGEKYLKDKNIPGQALPLIKNGCAGTEFNLENYEKILSRYS